MLTLGYAGGDPSGMASAIGLTVLHYLWQGAAIGLLAGAVLFAMRRRSAQARYLVGCVAMAIAFVAFVATFAIALDVRESPRTLAALTDAGAGSLAGALDFGDPTPYLPEIAWLWLLGTGLMVARLALQWVRARRLRTTGVEEADGRWKEVFRTLCRELGVTPSVKLMRSGVSRVPMVIGWLTPVVLVPASAFTSLSPDQLRSILAHEIAHIRRHDYLINCLQAFVECVLFFHPVVWWLSSRVRAEREHCCDDAVVSVTGDPVTYARALSALEVLRAEPGSLAVAAKGGSLMDRIKRIVGLDTDAHRSRRGGAITALLVAVVCLALMGLASATAQSKGDRPDLEAIWAKLQAMVKAGKITPEDAEAKMVAIKKGASKKKKTGRDFATIWAKLQAAVKAGKLSNEDALAKMDAIKKEAFANKKHFGHHKKKKAGTRYDKVWARLQAMVKAGALTAEEAKAMMAALKNKKKKSGAKSW